MTIKQIDENMYKTQSAWFTYVIFLSQQPHKQWCCEATNFINPHLKYTVEGEASMNDIIRFITKLEEDEDFKISFQLIDLEGKLDARWS